MRTSAWLFAPDPMHNFQARLNIMGGWEDSFLSDLVMAIVLSVAVRHLGPLGRGRGPRGGVLGRHAPQRLAGR